jgi:hypothetical protein
MTVAPERPYAHSYDPGKDPFQLVDTSAGRMERWRADALLIGEVSGLSELRRQVCNDAVAALDAVEGREAAIAKREAACDARERKITALAAQVSDLAGRIAVDWDRLQQAKADAERKPEAPLPEPPSASPAPSAAAPDDMRIARTASLRAVPAGRGGIRSGVSHGHDDH